MKAKGIAAALFGAVIVKDDTGGSAGGYLSSAAGNWNSAMGSSQWMQLWSGQTAQEWVVHVGSAEDSYLASVKGIESCAQEVSTYGLWQYHAWHSNFNHDQYGFAEFGRMCLNQTAHLHCDEFDCWAADGFYTHVTESGRTFGIMHEMGHALFLADDVASQAVMNLCWCYGVASAEASYVHGLYNR